MTAVDIALEAIDRLRVTAASHKRVFLVEVMGRDSGHLALVVGIAGGAEAIVIPEAHSDPESVAEEVLAAYQRGKSHAIVVVAEGAKYNAEGLARHFREHQQRLGFELRVSTLGHIQRGGSPGVFDRMIATLLGAAAIEYLDGSRHGVLLGIVDGKVTPTALSAVVNAKKPLDNRLLSLASSLAQ
jgi:6-phosphofructokinase 1